MARPGSRSLVVLAIAGALASASPAAAVVSHVHSALTPTGKVPGARGSANLVARGSHGRFALRAKKLPAGATFDVIVDTVRIGALTTNAAGAGKARFSTKPSSRDQLLGTDPAGKLVEVRDSDGDDVLDTDMPGDTNPGDIRCCLADEGETECETKTADECTAEGGTNLGEGSCLPNPCPTTPGDEQVQCCQADHDEDGPECEVTSASECSNDGGTSLGAGTCDPNPCTPTPPPDGTVACCVPDHSDEIHTADTGGEGDGGDESEAECEITTAAACDALGGTHGDATSCDPDPCAPTTTTTITETTTTTESTTTTTLI